MTDLRDQLRAYGRQIERDLADRPGASDTPAEYGPPHGRPRPQRHRTWLLVAAVTATVAVTAAVLPIALRSEEEDMRKGSGAVLGLCLLAAACGTDQNSASTTGPAPPTTSAAAAAPPSPTPSTGSVGTSLLDGPETIDPGTYVVDKFVTPIQVTMPAGWQRLGGVAVKGPDEAVLAFPEIAAVYTDSCNWIDSAAPVGPTVDDLVSALRAQQGTQTTDPQPLTVDGFNGYQFEVSKPDGSDFTKCYGGQRSFWKDVDGAITDMVGSATPATVWVLDLAGRRAVVSFMSYQPMSASTEAELTAIVDSIRVG